MVYRWGIIKLKHDFAHWINEYHPIERTCQLHANVLESIVMNFPVSVDGYILTGRRS